VHQSLDCMTMKIITLQYYEMPGTLYSRQCHTPEDLMLQQDHCDNLKKVLLPPTCSSIKMGHCVVWSVCGSHMNIGSEELLRLWYQSFMYDSTVYNFSIH
jgi:hypothetical protein